LSRAQRRLALLETGLGLALWLGLALAVGPVPFLLSFGIPLLVGNAIIMSLILTNHSLSPHTAVNDPLVNSLSITGPRWLEWLTLGFGYHVEHHLFPAMSARHGRELQKLLRQRWPERYQSLPYLEALLALHRSPRVYKDDTTLVDPSTGITTPTLGPRILRTEPAARRDGAAAEGGDVQGALELVPGPGVDFVAPDVLPLQQ
jgi:fatty acid desaturase